MPLVLMIMISFTIAAQQTEGYRIAKEKLPSLKHIRSLGELDIARKFIEQELDFYSIENTTLWKEYIQYWVAFYARPNITPEEFADEFLPVAKIVIDRTREEHSKTAVHLSNDLIEFFDQYGLDNAAASIAAYATYGIDVPASEFSIIASRILTASRLEQGGVAPKLNGLNDSIYANSIIVFHETGCGNCEWQMEQLADQCKEIEGKGYRIISVSADPTQEVFESKANGFTWKDKLCDFQGFEGGNFINYGVIHSPVFYLTDETGKVKGRYARIDKIPLMMIEKQ